MDSFAALPPGPTVPSVSQLVEAISAGLPAGDRPRAIGVLTDAIGWHLRGQATDPDPRRLAEVVYEDLVERLAAVPSAQRLAAVESIGCEAAGQRHLADAMALAIARYLLAHPSAQPAPAWLDGTARWRGADAAALAAEADRQLAAIEARQADATAPCARALRSPLLHARTALAAARTGAFATASGSLVDFLRDVGETPRVLDVH